MLNVLDEKQTFMAQEHFLLILFLESHEAKAIIDKRNIYI